MDESARSVCGRMNDADIPARTDSQLLHAHRSPGYLLLLNHVELARRQTSSGAQLLPTSGRRALHMEGERTDRHLVVEDYLLAIRDNRRRQGLLVDSRINMRVYLRNISAP